MSDHATHPVIPHRITRRRLAALAAVPAIAAGGLAVTGHAPAAHASQATPESGWDLAALGLSFEEVAGDLSNPLWVTSPPDDPRLFVVEQTGTVRIVADGALLPAPFLDVSDRITTQGSEQGLLGLAFHPDYAANGTCYAYYTDTGGTVTVSRFTVTDDPDVADPASESVVLTQEKPFENHNGGAIVFGPDGYLYLGLGDGGSAGDPDRNAQNLGTRLGKLLRIAVDPAADGFTAPDDNPFVGQDGALPEIWAYGLRNPWRISFDRGTGDLWIADVGQDEWEEIDVQPAGSPGGENYGWDLREATHDFEVDGRPTDGLVAPVLEYSHSEGVSVTGGYVYRGAAIPDLVGTYLYADFATGLLWGAVPAGEGAYVASLPIETGFNISSFGEDVDGELYMTLFDNGEGGRVVRIVAGA